jgi:pyruvate/2-oxoglutarate dehydrogenase complex dihydrolipoamide dehydrogenase (E3) component
MTDQEFDVVVVGGGVGGMAAVRNLASAGLSVALVEDRLVGGECRYWACNPTRTLVRPIEVFNLAKAVPGVREAVSGEGLDVPAVFAKRDAIVEHLSDQSQVSSLRRAGVAVFHGFGRLAGHRTVRVASAEDTEIILTARHAVVVATGTRPNVPEVAGLAQARPWTNRDVATMTQVPPRALLVGGGVVAVEFATILAGLGSAVTLLVRGESLLHNCEPEAGELVEQSLRSKGVKIHFETELSAVARPAAGGPVTATFHGQTIEVDEIVLATGRRVNTDNIGLETVGLPVGGFVSVNDHLQAIGVTGGWLYAVGDTTGRALLSHISTYHGRVVADIIAARAAGRELSENELSVRDSGSVAQVIFTDPQVAEVGARKVRLGQQGSRYGREPPATPTRCHAWRFSGTVSRDGRNWSLTPPPTRCSERRSSGRSSPSWCKPPRSLSSPRSPPVCCAMLSRRTRRSIRFGIRCSPRSPNLSINANPEALLVRPVWRKGGSDG